MVKRTHQPNKRHRAKTHGFLTRSKSLNGRAVLQTRRRRGRQVLAVAVAKRLRSRAR